MTSSVLIAMVIVAYLLLVGCSYDQPLRPEGVPSEAVYSPGGKIGGWWQHCVYDSGRMAVRCTVWNARGEVLVDDDYAAYDAEPIQPAELVISDKNAHAGGGYIRLSDGRYLIPRSKFAEGKRFLDESARH